MVKNIRFSIDDDLADHLEKYKEEFDLSWREMLVAGWSEVEVKRRMEAEIGDSMVTPDFDPEINLDDE